LFHYLNLQKLNDRTQDCVIVRSDVFEEFDGGKVDAGDDAAGRRKFVVKPIENKKKKNFKTQR
jgi:hypothetical protein